MRHNRFYRAVETIARTTANETGIEVKELHQYPPVVSGDASTCRAEGALYTRSESVAIRIMQNEAELITRARYEHKNGAHWLIVFRNIDSNSVGQLVARAIHESRANGGYDPNEYL